jgi:hypothetical protein
MIDKYRVMHIVPEIFQDVSGGIGSVVNVLYNYRSSEDCFVKIPTYCGKLIGEGNGNQINEDVFEYDFEKIINLESIGFSPEIIFFHHSDYKCLPNLKTKAKKILVVHSLPHVDWEKNMDNVQAEKYKLLFLDAYKNCDAIVTVSMSEKKRIEDFIIKVFDANKSI